MSDLASEAESPRGLEGVLGSGNIRLGDASLTVINSPKVRSGWWW